MKYVTILLGLAFFFASCSKEYDYTCVAEPIPGVTKPGTVIAPFYGKMTAKEAKRYEQDHNGEGSYKMICTKQ